MQQPDQTSNHRRDHHRHGEDLFEHHGHTEGDGFVGVEKYLNRVYGNLILWVQR
jgi:hypothetical protein